MLEQPTLSPYALIRQAFSDKNLDIAKLVEENNIEHNTAAIILKGAIWANASKYLIDIFINRSDFTPIQMLVNNTYIMISSLADFYDGNEFNYLLLELYLNELLMLAMDQQVEELKTVHPNVYNYIKNSRDTGKKEGKEVFHTAIEFGTKVITSFINTAENEIGKGDTERLKVILRNSFNILMDISNQTISFTNYFAQVGFEPAPRIQSKIYFLYKDLLTKERFLTAEFFKKFYTYVSVETTLGKDELAFMEAYSIFQSGDSDKLAQIFMGNEILKAIFKNFIIDNNPNGRFDEIIKQLEDLIILFHKERILNKDYFFFNTEKNRIESNSTNNIIDSEVSFEFIPKRFRNGSPISWRELSEKQNGPGCAARVVLNIKDNKQEIKDKLMHELPFNTIGVVTAIALRLREQAKQYKEAA